MVNLVDIFETMINAWNTETKCGFCWRFLYARKDLSNLAKLDEANKCCVHFILEKKFFEKKYNIDEDLGMSVMSSIEHSFEAFVGMPSDFTIQYHNELSYDKSEGKYEMYIKKIEDCLCENLEVNLCNVLSQYGSPAYFTYLKVEPRINYKDINFDGVFIRGKIRVDYI